MTLSSGMDCLQEPFPKVHSVNRLGENQGNYFMQVTRVSISCVSLCCVKMRAAFYLCGLPHQTHNFSLTMRRKTYKHHISPTSGTNTSQSNAGNYRSHFILSRKVQGSISANWSLRRDDSDGLWYPGEVVEQKNDIRGKRRRCK